ncbi:importin-4-like [Microplitis mediator]|uniref:importin-4-like n=1 Tax=Microplitis mediator TaxID=375433 RepID=UPI002557ADE8|nr:importin-4-like [Microplitis mediator]
MEEILAKLLVTDSAVIKQGTAELRAALKAPESVSILCQIIISSDNSAIRQYAAVLLRKRYAKGKHWSKLPFNIKTQVKSILLQGLLNESEKINKMAIAQLIGVIVKHELPNNTWPELFQFIQQLVSSDNIVEKGLGVFTLSQMTEVAPEIYTAHLSSLASLLVETYRSLSELGNPVAFYIIKIMRDLAPLVEGNQAMVNAYNQMIPLAMGTIQSFSSVDPDKAQEAMELFDDLCDNAVTLISPHLKNYVLMCLAIGDNRTLDDMLRVRALTSLATMIRVKSRGIIKHKLMEPIVEVLFKIMCTPEDGQDEDEFNDENETFTPVTRARETMVVMATHLRSEKLVPLLLCHIDPSLQRDDIWAKQASFLTIASLAKGCSEYIRSKYLVHFLKYIHEGINDGSHIVMNAALYALGKFSEYLQPEISQYSQQLLPVLFDYLRQMCVHLSKEKSQPPAVDCMFYALETFCENLNDEIIQYLPTLMERLFETLSIDAPTHIKELAISAIGAAANASQQNMLPYFPKIIAILDPYLTAKPNDDTMSLQVQSIDTLGIIVRTIGEDNFAPLVGKTIDLGLKLITENNDPDIRKAVYGLFASLASITKKEIAPALPQILEYIFNSILSSEGIVSQLKEYEDAAYPIYEDLSDTENEEEEDIEHTDNEDDGNDDDDVAAYMLSSSYIEEKEEAILALREIAHYTEEAFLPYLEKAFEEVFKLINYPQDDIKKVSLDALAQFCINFSKIYSSEGKQALLKALSVFIPKLSEIIRLDIEATVVISGLEALAELLKEVKGEVLVGEGHKEAIMNCVTDVFTGKIECQDQEDPDDDDEAEQDEFLVECAGDVLSNFGKAIPAEDFANYFKTVLPFLKDRLKENKSDPQRSFAVGTISECLSALRHMTSTFVSELWPFFKKRTQDPSPEVRNNAYYGIGELVFWGRESVYCHYTEILQLLSNALQTEEHPGPRDNMVGIIARLIITNYSLIDIEIVFPGFVQQLPLKKDFEEYQSVFKAILTLYRDRHQVINPHISKLVMVAINILHEKKVPDDETKQIVFEFIHSVQQDFPNEWNAAFAQLSPELRQTLAR